MPPLEPAPPALRDRQRSEAHALILRTAHELASEHGVAAVSVQGISRAAGISARTFFNHFRSKDEALVPDMPSFDPAAERAFVAPDGRDLVTALDDLMGDHLARVHTEAGVSQGPLAVKQLVEANPELLPRALAVFEAFNRRLAALIAERSGLPPDALFCTVSAAAATATTRAAIGAWQDSGADQGEALRDLVHRAFTHLRAGLASSA